MNATPETVLSLSELARRVCCHAHTLRVRVERGELRPDFQMPAMLGRRPAPLFRESRLPQIWADLAGPQADPAQQSEAAPIAFAGDDVLDLAAAERMAKAMAAGLPA